MPISEVFSSLGDSRILQDVLLELFPLRSIFSRMHSLSQCWKHPWLCFDELLCLCFSPSVDVISSFFSQFGKNGMIPVLPAVSLPAWGWDWTQCVAQFSTESSRRNKLKGMGERMGGEAEGSSLFLS